MNIREKAIEFISKNPGSTARQIACGADIPGRVILSLLNELFLTDVVVRARGGRSALAYRIAEPSDIPAVNDEYEKHRVMAIGLEQKKLWRRAAGVWALAMDSTRNETARANAIERRKRCITHGRMPRLYSEGSSISVASVPELDNWRDF